MEFENLKLKCECKGNMKPIKTEWKGISVKGWKCEKCHEEVLNPIDSQKAEDTQRMCGLAVQYVKPGMIFIRNK